MPSAGRTSMPSRVAAPLILAVCVTLRLFGSMVTIDLPSTRPMMEAACAEEATKEVVTAPASRIVLKVLNMGVAPVERLSPTEPAWFRSDREQLRGQGRDGCIALEVFFDCSRGRDVEPRVSGDQNCALARYRNFRTTILVIVTGWASAVMMRPRRLLGS